VLEEHPREVAAHQERPVVRDADADDVVEDTDENDDGRKRVQQCPEEAEHRPLVTHLEVAGDEPRQQLAVPPQIRQHRRPVAGGVIDDLHGGGSDRSRHEGGPRDR
jgi:hypothetical protein